MSDEMASGTSVHGWLLGQRCVKGTDGYMRCHPSVIYAAARAPSDRSSPSGPGRRPPRAGPGRRGGRPRTLRGGRPLAGAEQLGDGRVLLQVGAVEAFGLAHRVEEQPHLGRACFSIWASSRALPASATTARWSGWPRRRPPSPPPAAARPRRHRGDALAPQRCRAPAPRARRGRVRGRRPRRRRPPGWPRPPRGGACWHQDALGHQLASAPRAACCARRPGRRPTPPPPPPAQVALHAPARAPPAPPGRPRCSSPCDPPALGEHVLQHRVGGRVRRPRSAPGVLT